MHGNLAINIVGWVGVAMLLLAYWMVSTKRMEGSGIAFQLLNILGAAGLVTNSYYYGALPSVGVNVAWIAIGGYALLRAIRSRWERPVSSGQ